MVGEQNMQVYVKRLAAAVRAWCRDESLRHLDEWWMVEQLASMVLTDRTCARRLRAAGLAQGVADSYSNSMDYLGETLGRKPANVLADLLSEVLDSSDAVLIGTLRGRLVMVTRNNLFHRWKESDPIGASIDRSLWEELRNHPERYLLLPDDPATARYVTVARDGQLRAGCRVITRDEMVRLIAEVWKESRQIPPCVRDVLSIIRDDDQWSALVPISEVLFAALCDAARGGIMRQEHLKLNPCPMAPDVGIAYEASLEVMLPHIAEVADKYARDGKLPRAVTEGMIQAVKLIFDDFALSGDRDVGYRDYVLRCCPGLSLAEYEEKVKSKFQYLMRLASETLDGEFRKRWGE